ncbi:MAG: Hpt domain-containing protein, partial [Gammaproteobacteria bacterium]
MAAIQQATSLNLVKEELDATLRQAEAGLADYAANPGNAAALEPCIEALHQAWGVLRVLEIPGGAELAQELENVAREVSQSGPDEARLAALGNSIMVLGRYIEFMQIKGRGLPQLLVPALNALRQSIGKPPVPESAFFSCDLAAKRPGEGTDALESDAEIQRLARRLRQMYQVGLLGVLRGENPA